LFLDFAGRHRGGAGFRSSPAAPPPDAAKIPLSKIPRVHRAPKLDDFLENHPREAELTVTDFRQNSPATARLQRSPVPPISPTTTRICTRSLSARRSRRGSRASFETRSFRSGRRRGHPPGHLPRLSPRLLFFLESPGVQTDAIYTEGQGYDYSFDTLWANAGRVLNDGYIVFFSIPFKSLRFSHAPEQTWGVALYRVILRKSEYDYWPYVTQRVAD